MNFLGSHVESFVKEKTNANTNKTDEAAMNGYAIKDVGYGVKFIVKKEKL